MAERRNPPGAWLRTNRGVGAVLLLVLAAYFAYLALTPWSGRGMRDGFALGFFPALGAGLMALCAAAMIVDSHRREVSPALAALDIRGLGLVLAVILGGYAYFELMLWLGFLLATPFFLFALMVVLGLRALRSAIGASLVMTALIYALFRLIGVRLPSGLLPF